VNDQIPVQYDTPEGQEPGTGTAEPITVDPTIPVATSVDGLLDGVAPDVLAEVQTDAVA
jgi:hypothetical protein